jgi:hypothetical protein
VSNFTQDLFSSRRNYSDGNTRIGDKDRLWYDSITNTIRIGDGVTPGGTIVSGAGNTTTAVSDNPPTDEVETGDLWWESDTGRLKIRYSDTWVDASPVGSSGPEGGYEFTGGFLNRSNAITYSQDQAAAGTWMRFGFSSAKQLTTDGPYWGDGPDPDEAPHAGTTAYQGVGSFSGAYMPSSVTSMFDFDDNTAYNQALTMSVTTAGVTENLPVTAALGSYNFKQYKVGDFANIRVDFNVTPHISNTTLECALIWSTRDANDNITFTFPLTITPFFFGDNTAGKQFLTRPMFTAYFASQEDVNARALFAIKSDNRITVEPFTTLTTVVAR